MKKIIYLFLSFFSANFLFAQQWIDKTYTYDSLLNIKYGSAINFIGGTDSLKLDLYLPNCDQSNAAARRPLMIWIHGGSFLAGDKSESNITNLCKQFAKRGYVTASINYRLGFISDDVAWTCNYPNYSCLFATDSVEWYRAYYRAVQDGKGALRYLINKNAQYKIDTNSVFVSGESAGAFVALGVGLLDTIQEKPVQASAVTAAPKPIASALSCPYSVGKTFSTSTISRPDLGGIDGIIEPTTVRYTIKGIGNMYGAMMTNLLKYKPYNKTRPAIFSFHQPCDIIVPIDSGKVYQGLSWCMTNGYNCYAIAYTPKIYGSRAFSNWNTTNNHGYNIHNEFTTTNFPYSFLFGTASCSDQVNNPCHAYDNVGLREANLANFFAPLITTNPICTSTTLGIGENGAEAKTAYLIYPQPAHHELTISHQYGAIGTVKVFSVMGQVMQAPSLVLESSYKFNTSTWPSGMYFISIQNEGAATQILRVVIVATD